MMRTIFDDSDETASFTAWMVERCNALLTERASHAGIEPIVLLEAQDIVNIIDAWDAETSGKDTEEH